MAPPFDTIRVFNPHSTARSHVQEFALPCRDKEVVSLTDRFYAINPTLDGQNYECGVERSASFNPSYGVNRYASGNERVLRLTMPVRLRPGYNDIQIFRGTVGTKIPFLVRPNVLTGLNQLRIVLRPFGGAQDLVLFNGLNTTPVEIKQTEYSTLLRFRARASQPRQSGGHPFWAELFLELFGAGLDHCRWWCQWGVSDPRDPQWEWFQLGQSDPRVMLMFIAPEAAGEYFPYTRIFNRGTWHGYERWHGAVGGGEQATILVLDRDDPESNWGGGQAGIGGYYMTGQAARHMGTLWFAGAAGQTGTGDPFRDATRDAETQGRETSALSTSWYAKGDAYWGGFVTRPPVPEAAASLEAFRTLYHNAVENDHNTATPRQVGGGNASGPWQHGEPFFSSAVRLAHFLRAATGATADHRSFGMTRHWLPTAIGMPTIFETLRLAGYVNGHPMFHREIDGSPVRAASHPNLLTLRNLPTTLFGYVDTLGKSGSFDLRRCARDADDQYAFNAPAWEGTDGAHYEDIGFPLFAVLSQDRMLYELIDLRTEAILQQYPTIGGRGNHLAGQCREIGRRIGTMASLYYACSRQDLWDNIDHATDLLEAELLAGDAAYPGRIVRPMRVFEACGSPNCALAFSGGPYPPNDWRSGLHWRPWEESRSAGLMWMSAHETRINKLRTLTEGVVTNIIRFAQDINLDPAHGPVFQGTALYRQSMRYVGATFLTPGTRKLTEAEFATGANRGGPMDDSLFCLQSQQGGNYQFTYLIARHIANRDGDATLLAYVDAIDRGTGSVGGPFPTALPARLGDFENNSYANGDTSGPRNFSLPSVEHIPNSPPVVYPPIHGSHAPKLYPYSKDQPWTNRMRTATMFGEYTGENLTNPTLTNPRADGYPASIPGGMTARCVACDGETALYGNWRLRWDGDGEVGVFWNGGSTQLNAINGELNFVLAQGYERLSVRILSTNGANNVRNIRLYYTAYEAFLAGRGFDPDFAARWRRLKLNACRFSHWTEPDSHSVTTAATRRADGYFTECSLDARNDEFPTRQTQQGSSWQAIFDFITEFNLDYAAIPVPRRTWEDANETWVEDFCAAAAAACPAKTQFIFSNTNEHWNSQFVALNYFRDYGVNGGPRGEAARRGLVREGGGNWNVYEQGRQAYALRASQIFAAARGSVLGDRAKGMIEWQCASGHTYEHSLYTRLLSDTAGVDYNPPRKIDYHYASVTLYTSQNLHIERNNAQLAAMTPADFSAYVQADINNRLMAHVSQSVRIAAALAAADNANFCPYEFGKHEWSPGMDTPAVNALYNYYRSAEHRADMDLLFRQARSIPTGVGHGFFYHNGGWGSANSPSVASPFGLWEDYDDDGGARPGTAGMNDEQAYLSYEASANEILGGNNPPRVTNPGTQVALEQTAFSLQIEASDPDAGDILSYAMTGHPGGLSIAAATGLITGSPNAGTAAGSPYTITVTVTDTAANAVPVTFTMHVRPQGAGGGNTAPTLTNPGTQVSQEGEPFSLQLVATDPDVPPQTLAFYVEGLPDGLSVNEGTGLISGTPGPDTHRIPVRQITAIVADSEGAVDLQDFELLIEPPVFQNNPPTLANPGNQVYQEGVLIAPLQLNGIDPDGDPITYGAINLPAGLSLDANSGLITGTPATGSSQSNSQGLPPGYYFIEAACWDQYGAPSNLVQFVIQITPPAGGNRPPIWTIPGLAVATEGLPFQLQMEVFDPEGDQLLYAAINMPAGLSINSSTGLISGTPEVGTAQPLPYTCTFAVTDNINPPVGGPFYIAVQAQQQNNPPTLENPGPQFAVEGRGFHLRLIWNDPDPGDEVTFTMEGHPNGLTIDGRGVITGVPARGTARPFAYQVTVVVRDLAGAQDSETFDVFVYPEPSTGRSGHLANADLYMAVQMVPAFRGSGPSAITTSMYGGCAGYEIGNMEIAGSSKLADVISEWYAWPYVTQGDKHEPHPEELTVSFGGRWTLRVELNTRQGGVMWRWRLTDSDGAPLVPAGFNLLTQADGTGRAAAGDLTLYVPGDDAQEGQIRAGEGSQFGLARVDTGSDWLGAAAPMAHRTPRWTHGSPTTSISLARPAAGRIDVQADSIPLDWRTPTARGTILSPLCPVLFNFEQRRLTRFNWPRPGIHTTFRNMRLFQPTPQIGAWGVAMEVLGAYLHEGFDERHLFDAADGAKTWTNLSGDPLHAQFVSGMHGGVTEHAHNYDAGKSYLLAILDTATWPAAYREVGTRLTVNIASLNRTAGAISVGLPAIPDTVGLPARVAALGVGAATVQIDVSSLVNLGPPWTSGGVYIPGFTYTGGTFTFPALQLHYVTGAGDSLMLAGRETIVIDPNLPPGQRGARVRAPLVTDGQGRCGMVLRCDGNNVRAVPGYSFEADFSIGVACTLVGDDLVVNDRVNGAFTYLGAKRVTPAVFQEPGTERASAYQQLRFGIQQAIEQDKAGTSRVLSGQVADGVVDVDMWTQLPCYMAMGTFAEVQAHFEWLLDNGWLDFPLTSTKYHSVP